MAIHGKAVGPNSYWLAGPTTQPSTGEMFAMDENFEKWLDIHPARADKMFPPLPVTQVCLNATPRIYILTELFIM
jgi:hypothetical protein